MIEDLLIATFCMVDDFCKNFEPEWKQILLEHSNSKNVNKITRFPTMSLSEIMTIAIHFHQSGYRTFKQYYILSVKDNLKKYFPTLVSYSRFIRFMSAAVFPIFCFLKTILGVCSGISFIDSTLLTVCHNRRISSHKVFKGISKIGKTSTGWFYGFKLHLVINHKGEIISYMLTSGNIDDRKPVKKLSQDLFGRLFGDKGYISSSLFHELYSKGVQLITRLKSNMKNKFMPILDKLLLRRRGLIESVHNRLKNGAQIEHHRHRSKWNFLTNLLGGLVSYQLNQNKPSIKLVAAEEQLLLSECA